ncbi:MAG: DUF1910 domain-containing protein [Gallicola sp.]|nr:DUF1910 domain-containing protein [Gallicola sp.]
MYDGTVMRDQLKSESYFTNLIQEDELRIQNFQSRLDAKSVAENRIASIEAKIRSLKIGVDLARYSRGDDLSGIKKSLEDVLPEIIKNYSLSSYHSRLEVLSFIRLFNLDNAQKSLSERMLGEAGKEDWLFNFLLHYNGSNLPEIQGVKI